MSRRKRSLSILSFDLMSQSRQESGEISSATTMRIRSPSQRRPRLHLEVDEADADAEEEAGQEVVDADGQRHDVVDLLRRRPAEGGDVLFRHHRVVERVVLVVELDDRARQLRALLEAEARRERAGGDVAHHHLERDDLDLADELLAHVQPADEMRRHADVVQVLEDVFARCGC